MKKSSHYLLSLVMVLTLVSTGVGDAFAARLGGGKSFGGSPSYSTPFNRSGGYNQASPSQRSVQQPSMASQRNQAARENMGRRGGLMGMLGGLALGGLLGAMFFGGAFEGINFMDILLFAGVAFLLFKLFASRRQGGLEQNPVYGSPRGADYEPAYQRNVDESGNIGTGRAGFNTDVLFKKGTQANPPLAIPSDFDANEFLARAKSAFAYLQQAWDRGDLAELRGLCSDKVFSELQDQIKARAGDSRTELLKVEAELLDVRDTGAERNVAVMFDVLLRENPGLAPSNVKEVWHFVRSKASNQPTWFLDGIQQVED